MAGTQYVYSEGDAAWFGTFLARAEKTSKGMSGIILTNYTTSVVCAIAAGSVVEIDGAMFHFDAETSVTGAVATGVNYIVCSVTGTDASPYWSQDIFSTYDTAKAGLYTGASRYVAECHYGATSTEYYGKYVYPERTRDLRRKIPLGDWVMNATVTKSIQVLHDLGSFWAGVRNVSVLVTSDDDDIHKYLWSFQDQADPSLIGGGMSQIDTDTINLTRRTGGAFDNANFNATPFNRGFATIWYEV